MGTRRATAQTIVLVAIDAAAAPARRTGVSWTTGDVKISKDGGAFANTANLPVEIGTTGRYSLALTAAEMDATFVHVTAEKAGVIQPIDFGGITNGDKSGTVVANGSNVATSFQTDLAEGTSDHWKDALLLFTTGTLAGQVKKVTAFNATTDFVTVSGGFTAAPTAGDRFVLVNL